MQPPTSIAGPPPREPLVTPIKCSLLIVDDEPQVLKVLTDLLEKDFEVLTATMGESAKEPMSSTKAITSCSKKTGCWKNSLSRIRSPVCRIDEPSSTWSRLSFAAEPVIPALWPLA